MDQLRFARIEQTFDAAHIKDVRAEVLDQIRGSGLRIQPGARVAIAVGSRGIANIDVIAAAVVQSVRSQGGDPFIVPAMGSHGGATAEGQAAVLAGYGITEASVGAPIRSSMKVRELDSTGLEHKLYMDACAYDADGVIAINRVKVHTDFHGTTESGVMKMLIIGLGKHAQALTMHSFGVRGLRELIPVAARRVIETGKIILGLGICENAYDQTAMIRAMPPHRIESIEREMIAWNRAHMPALPVDRLDVLLVDAMGKDISGAGLDTNIIGRMRISGEPEPASPRIGSIVVDDLTEKSHGNAAGMGLADFITQKLRDKVDFQATYENIITSTFVMRGAMPIVAADAKQALGYALRTCGRVPGSPPRVLRIPSTLHLSHAFASEALWAELRENPRIIFHDADCDIFTADGGLRPF